MLTHVPNKIGLFADDLWGTSQTRIRDYMVVTQAATCYISPHNPHSYPKAWNITTRSPGKQDTSFSPGIQDLHLGFRRSAGHKKFLIYLYFKGSPLHLCQLGKLVLYSIKLGDIFDLMMLDLDYGAGWGRKCRKWRLIWCKLCSRRVPVRLQLSKICAKTYFLSCSSS